MTLDPGDNERIGAAVRRYRERLDLSQTMLARRMADLGHSWHQMTVARTESGERPLRLDEAIAIASVLEIDVEGLYRTVDEDDRSTYAEILATLRESEVELQGLEAEQNLTKKRLEDVAAEADVAQKEYESAVMAARMADERVEAALRRLHPLRADLANLEVWLEQITEAKQIFRRSVDRQHSILAALDEPSFSRFRRQAQHLRRSQVGLVRELYEQSFTPADIAEMLGDTTDAVEEMIYESDNPQGGS